ncbi:MAG: endonuclease [Acidobacteriota bacterium]|nr:endonuclease [Acidobacteriota bacterium]
MGIAKPELKSEAIRLRIKGRHSLREIESLTGAARGSLSIWLKPYPLTEEEKRARSKLAKRYIPPKKSHGEESKHNRTVAWRNLTPYHKGRIAETAVLFRLALHGFSVYSSLFDGDKADWLVQTPKTGKVLKVQIRCVNATGHHGLPNVLLTCAEGHNRRKRYEEGEFDFIVGYYLYNDTAYVFSFDEVRHLKTYVTVSEEYAERWDKLKT